MNISEKIHSKIRGYVTQLEKYADRVWYPPLIGILAALDNFIIVIPNDGILVASSMLIPKRWAIYATAVSIGSSIGAVALCLLAQHKGLPWVLEIYPDIDQSQVWIWTEKFFENYGLIIVFLIGISPLMQQPVVIIAALGHTPLFHLALVILISRLLKFHVMAYIGSHSPKYLKKIWGMKDELKDAGIKIE